MYDLATAFILVILFLPILMIAWFLSEAGKLKRQDRVSKSCRDSSAPTDVILKQREERKDASIEVLDFTKTTRRSVQTRYFTIWFYDDTRKWEITSEKDRTGSFRGQIGSYIGYKFFYDDIFALQVQTEDLGEEISTFSFVSRTLIGNALMGEKGAIIGGLTAKENQYVRDINFVVFQNRRRIPEIVLPLCIGKCKTSGATYQDALESAKRLEAAFRLINARD